MLSRLHILACFLLISGLSSGAVLAAGTPVLIGLDAEFGYKDSTSAEAIRQGMQLAIEEINARGGVLGGRPLQIIERANHSTPARSIANIKELAAMPDMVAVYGGRFSPTILEALPTIHTEKIILLDPWGAADGIIENSYQPNYAFRLSLVDSWAMGVMLKHAESKGVKKVGLLLLNTSWGRSNLKSAEEYVVKHPRMQLVGTYWFNWNDTSLIDKYQRLRKAGAQALILVANASDAAILLNEVGARPKAEWMPIISHWGVTGGNLSELVGPLLDKLDFSVVQTYSFIGDKRPKTLQVVASHNRLFGSKGARDIASPVGVAHAYDLTHLLARAIDQAGTTDRAKVREALEKLGPYNGLIKSYPQPFTAERHEALTPADVFMARYAADGAIIRIAPK